MTKTRKLPVNLRADGHASSKSEHLAPSVSPGEEQFQGVKTGKKYATGMIAYLGTDVSADDILKQLNLNSPDAKRMKPLIEDYICQLQEFKIGNVLSIHHADGKLLLKKEAERPPSETSGSKLPS